MSIITISGCDGSGKSSICEELIPAVNGLYSHFSNPKDMLDGKKQYFDFLKSTEADKTYVCDRYHDGEWVYAPLYRNYMANYMKELELDIIQKHNYLFSYIKADVDTIINRTRVRGEDFVKDESHYQIILDNFHNNFLINQKMPFTVVDTTNITKKQGYEIVHKDYDKLNKIWENTKNCINNCQDCCECVTPLMLPRGNMRAKYMIVGQNPGGRGKGKDKFGLAWAHGSASEFMIDVLKQAGIYLDCWFTNVVLCSTKDNKITEEQALKCIQNLKLQIDLIQPEKIFTLGKESTKYVKQFFKDSEVIEVPHPSYIKRFYSKNNDKMNEYIKYFHIGE